MIRLSCKHKFWICQTIITWREYDNQSLNLVIKIAERSIMSLTGTFAVSKVYLIDTETKSLRYDYSIPITCVYLVKYHLQHVTVKFAKKNNTTIKM